MRASNYVNEIMIAMLLVTGLALIASATMLVSSVKKLTAAYSAAEAVPANVPLLAQRTEPYTQGQYEPLRSRINADNPIKVEALKDKLIITSPDINSEVQWRRAVSDAMALDRNLHSQRVCGSVSNACTGAALVAELVGARQILYVKE